MASWQLINAAGWIWLPDYDDAKQEARFVLFRKVFQLTETPSNAVLVRVSADTRYRMLVNGERASFGPCKSYLSRWYFEEVDIGSLLRKGQNVISIRVLRFSPAYLGNSSMIRGSLPGLILQGHVGEIKLDTNETWRAIEDNAITIVARSEWDFALGPPFMCLNERYDQRLSENDWTAPDFDDSKWVNAVPKSARSRMMPILEPRRLSNRPIPLLPEVEKRFASALKQNGNTPCDQWTKFLQGNQEIEVAAGTTEIVDIEVEVLTTGFLRLACEGNSGARITILCAESYERKHTKVIGKIGASRFKADRRDFKTGELYGPTDVYITGKGFNVYEPFWFRTFRFVRLTIQTTAEQSLTLKSFDFRETHYPLDIETHLSADGLDDLWKISLNTLRNCMHETYEDCPFYEQNQFAMDTRIQILFSYQLSRDDRLARKCIHEFYASHRDDGLVETHFPVPFRAINIPQFSLYWVLMVCDHYQYFGDAAFARRYLGAIDGVLNHFLERREGRGLVGAFDEESWPFVDWVEEWHGNGGLQTMAIPPCYYSGDGVVTYNSLIFAYVLQQAAVLNATLGRKCVSDEYLDNAMSLTTAVNEHCWDGEMYTDGPSTSAHCQHSQVFAILAGAIEGHRAIELMKRALTTPDLPKCSYAMSFYIHRAAAKVGIYEEFFETLMQPWKKMIKNNMTTWAEDDLMFRSDCHGWSSSPIYEIVHEIFGISPATNGYTSITIAPKFTLLKSAKGIFCFGGGKIEIAWDESKKLCLRSNVEVMANVFIDEKTCTQPLHAEEFVEFGQSLE